MECNVQSDELISQFAVYLDGHVSVLGNDRDFLVFAKPHSIDRIVYTVLIIAYRI